MSRTTEPFTEPDIGNRGAGLEMRADFLGDRAANADRNADDDEVGAFDGLGVGLRHLVGEAELDDALSRLRRMRGCHDRAHGALRARGAGDGRADQPNPDDGERVEQRLASSAGRAVQRP